MGILGIIFRAIVYIAMVLVGVVLNYYIDSPIAVGLIMLTLSLLLNRKGGGKKSKEPKKKTQVTPQTGIIYCGNCGSKAKSGTLFCSSCGTSLQRTQHPTISPIETYSAPEILDQIYSLNRQYQTGKLDEKKYMNILNKSMFQDGWDRVWTVGANTLHWYRYDNRQWIKDTPTGNLSFM